MTPPKRELKLRQIGMTDGMYQALRRLADQDQTNAGELVRIAVEDMLRVRGEWSEEYRPAANEARLSRHMPGLGGGDAMSDPSPVPSRRQ